MKHRAMGLGAIPVVQHARQLPPGLSAEMPVGAQVAASEPAVVGAIRIRTEVKSGVDGAPASSGGGEHKRRRARRLGARNRLSVHKLHREVCGSAR